MNSKITTRARLLGTTIFAGTMLLATGQAYAQASGDMETVTVTGYRASLENAANVKRDAVGFTDAVFAEDIAKFPDTNIAESLNRIPGITITRDIDGSGVNVSIRGLGTNFTKITLNDAQIAIATTGATDARNNNREVDLNMFPSELFTQLKVDKSPRAELLEGGAAGNVDLRSRRPFDNPGLHFTYAAQGIDNSLTNGLGGNGALVLSNTWDSTGIGSFGVLLGVAAKHTDSYVRGWEDGNAGWITPTINNATLCGSASGCDITGSTTSIGGNSMSVPATIPTNVAIPGYAAGATVNAAMLQSLNPGLTMTQISNALLPRLGRTMYQRGTRDRFNGVASFEWRPTQNLHFYLDMIAGRQVNDLDRSDMDWGGRTGAGGSAMIPANLSVDANNVITNGTFYNSQFFLEARPYQEKGDFYSFNPGMSWQATDLLEVDFQLNASRSHFLRDSPTVMVVSCPSVATTPGCTPPVGGVSVNFANTSTAVPPTITTNLDLNNPANFQWNGGRVNLQDEKRYTHTAGAHLDLKYGGDQMMLKVGAAWDDIARGIAAIDGSSDWTTAICGGGTSTTCTGADGSIVTQSNLASYLQAGPAGFITANYNAIKSNTGYYGLDSMAQSSVNAQCRNGTGAYYSTASNTGGTSGCYEERVIGLYAQLGGKVNIGERALNYDFGLRWVETHQSVFSPVVANTAASYTYAADGYTRTYTSYNFSDAKNTYQAFLPSMNLVYHIADDFLVRGSVSRTMTRPDVSSMISVVNFSDTEAATATLGNPALKPYFSNNIDVGAEYYTGGEGYLSVALFRKGISGFTTSKNVTQPFSYLSQFGINWSTLTSSQQQNLTARWGCNSDASCASSAMITVTQQTNAPGMETINGMEWGYVQPLDFMLSQYGVKGLGVSANLTVVDQSSSGSASVHATGVAPYTYNLTGYYDNDGVMARMSYTFTAQSYASGSNTNSVCLPNTLSSTDACPGGAYLFALPYGQADFSSSLKLSRVFGELPSDPELTFSIQNVFNAKQRSVFQYMNAVHSYYEAGQTYMFGVHGNF
jgi:TonB-dependent receptor